MSTTSVTYPHEVDNPSWPIVREWHLSPDRRVLVVYDDSVIDCPIHDEEGAALWWNGESNRPGWDKDAPVEYERPEGPAYPFFYYDTRNGSRFDLMDDDDPGEPSGWIVMDDDWTDPLEAARGLITVLNWWAEGECYGYVVQDREATCSCGECTEWSTTESCWGYFGDTVLEALPDDVEGMEGVA